MTLQTVPNPIDSAGPVKQVLSNLFYGWGYNFYRTENQLRADDLLIRSKMSEILSKIRSHFNSVESDYRQVALPPPTRENPFPSPDALAVVRGIQAGVKAIEALETQIRNASVPEMDRIHQRYRNEKHTLEKLSELDQELVGHVLAFEEKMLAIHDAPELSKDWKTILNGSSIASMLNQRSDMLSII